MSMGRLAMWCTASTRPRPWSSGTRRERHHGVVRILITACPGLGHVLPVLPVGLAAAARGHDVIVATGADLGPAVERAGLRHRTIGAPSLEAAFGTIDGIAELTGRRRLLRIVTEGFATIFARDFAAGVLALAAEWRPDVIVREDMEMGSWMAAERLGIPSVVVQATAWRPPIRRLASEPQNRIRAEHGLPPDADLTGHDGALWFATRPPSLRSADPMPPTLRELRSAADDAVGAAREPDADMPDWLAAQSGRPGVAVTLGTVNKHRLDVFRPILAGLAALDVDVVVALGADPATLGDVPNGVRVERYVPMSALLPRSALVVHHAGSGTMLAAAAARTPQLLVPLAADQPENAALCVEAGIALRLDPDALTSEAVAAAAQRLLEEPSFRDRARAVAIEIAAMPDADTALVEVERLVSSWPRQS